MGDDGSLTEATRLVNKGSVTQKYFGRFTYIWTNFLQVSVSPLQTKERERDVKRGEKGMKKNSMKREGEQLTHSPPKMPCVTV